MSARFCTYCGASRGSEGANFCGSCGRPFSSGPDSRPNADARSDSVAGEQQAPSATYVPYGARTLPEIQNAAQRTGARKRPLWAVFLLTAGTFSLYFFVHLGLMWAEMKRAREDASMNPVGHALAQFVPVYGWARFHAHVRTLNEMLQSAGSSQQLNAGSATIVYILITAFAIFAGNDRTPTWLIFPSYAAYGAFASWRQRALNTYYDVISGGAIATRVHWFEWVVIVAGGLFLILAAIGTFML
jgi:hypothetical protein